MAKVSFGNSWLSQCHLLLSCSGLCAAGNGKGCAVWNFGGLSEEQGKRGHKPPGTSDKEDIKIRDLVSKPGHPQVPDPNPCLSLFPNTASPAEPIKPDLPIFCSPVAKPLVLPLRLQWFSLTRAGFNPFPAFPHLCSSSEAKPRASTFL